MAYIVTTNKGGKLFSSHKSARSFARNQIRQGADYAFINFKADPNDQKEEPLLRNVYRANVDVKLHTRTHVRVPVEGWANLMAQEKERAKTARR